MFEFPAAFKDRYCGLVDEPEEFLLTLTRMLPRTFRVNTIKSNVKEIKERFGYYGINIKDIACYNEAFISEEPDIGATLEHFLGKIYMQELVSMLPPLLIRKEIKDAGKILDGCAAPGSKTTQLAAFMENRGMIVANDLSYSRIRALKFNLEKTGVLNTVITNMDLNSFPASEFEIVLLDAPCSAEGTMRKNAELFSLWSEKEIKKYSQIQKQLILKSFDLLAPGGTMVYSTCTFAPEENEEVLQYLLENRDASLENIELDGLKISNSIEEWQGNTFDSEIKKARRIWPHHNDTGGFFLAKVRK